MPGPRSDTMMNASARFALLAEDLQGITGAAVLLFYFWPTQVGECPTSTTISFFALIVLCFQMGLALRECTICNRIGRRDRLLLWLRRFRNERGYRAKFDRALETVCCAMVHCRCWEVWRCAQ